MCLFMPPAEVPSSPSGGLLGQICLSFGQLFLFRLRLKHYLCLLSGRSGCGPASQTKPKCVSITQGVALQHVGRGLAVLHAHVCRRQLISAAQASVRTDAHLGTHCFERSQQHSSCFGAPPLEFCTPHCVSWPKNLAPEPGNALWRLRQMWRAESRHK